MAATDTVPTGETIPLNAPPKKWALPSDWVSWLILLIGLSVLYVPTFSDLLRTIWSREEQGHGPVVLAMSLWLLWRERVALFSDTACNPWPKTAFSIIALASLSYAIGRSQGIIIFEVGSLVWMLMGIVLLMRGPEQLRKIGFGLFFMLFMIPLPGTFVDAVTQPMKLAVSTVAEMIMASANYPVARSGVMLHVGQYQLLVADACAGLNTLFTLEAMGLLYLNVVRHSSILRNFALAVLVVPISFAANVTRVVALCLITYHLGDEAGQGFLHGFAGMVLFMTALILIMTTDSILRVASKMISKNAGADS